MERQLGQLHYISPSEYPMNIGNLDGDFLFNGGNGGVYVSENKEK
jgi:hypothetical protein